MAEKNDIKDFVRQFERTLQAGYHYELHLYVAGSTLHSARAVQSIKHLCSGLLKNRYRLHIFDIYKSPQLARQAQIIAVPTLVRVSPPPLRKLVGDLSDRNRVLRFLDLPEVAGGGIA